MIVDAADPLLAPPGQWSNRRCDECDVATHIGFRRITVVCDWDVLRFHSGDYRTRGSVFALTGREVRPPAFQH